MVSSEDLFHLGKPWRALVFKAWVPFYDILCMFRINFLGDTRKSFRRFSSAADVVGDGSRFLSRS